MKKGCSVVLGIFAVLIIMVCVIGTCSDNNNREVGYLRGVEPSLISTALKSFDFKVDYIPSSEYGYLWNMIGHDAYATYTVQLYSKEYSSHVESIIVNSVLNSVKGKPDYSLFHELAMQVKEECDPNVVSEWLSLHYNNPGDTLINRVSFSMEQPTALVKIFRIEKLPVGVKR